MIGAQWACALTGAMFAGFALLHLFGRFDRARWRSAAFWGVYAALLMVGPYLPDLLDGSLVLVMVGLAAIGLRPGRIGDEDARRRRDSARRLRGRLLVPALLVPLLAGLFSVLLRPLRWQGRALVDPAQVTLVALSLACIIALVAAMWLTRRPRYALLLMRRHQRLPHQMLAPLVEGRRLADAMGWAAVLPQMLAALGAVFVACGVGEAVSRLAAGVLPEAAPGLALLAYGLGMVALTIVTGNAFAAFPVMTAGIGLPLVVGRYGGDPVAMSSLGMLAGYCGTLLTPMAATFNIVPVALLGLPSRWSVIRVQAPTGAAVLVFILILMQCVVYRSAT